MGYRTKIKGSVKFDGQDVAYEMRHPTVSESIEKRNGNRADMTAFVNECTLRLDAIKDDEGHEVPREVIFTDFYFSPLVGELALALFAAGKVGEDDPSDGRSSAASTDVGSHQA